MMNAATAFAVLLAMSGPITTPTATKSVHSGPTPYAEKVDRKQADVSFVYFGARDCPSCRQFVNGYAWRVKQAGDQSGFTYIRKEVNRLDAILDSGAYGSYDTLQKAAMRKAGIDAVPLFAVIRDGKLVAAKAGRWKEMMNLAASMSDRPLSP